MIKMKDMLISVTLTYDEWDTIVNILENFTDKVSDGEKLEYLVSIIKKIVTAMDEGIEENVR